MKKMNNKLLKNELPSLMHKLGVSYFAYGTIKNGRKKIADYYKLCSPISDNQLNQLKEYFPAITTGKSVSQYAPELKQAVLILPK